MEGGGRDAIRQATYGCVIVPSMIRHIRNSIPILQLIELPLEPLGTLLEIPAACPKSLVRMGKCLVLLSVE